MSQGVFWEPGQGTIYSARGSRMVFKALHGNTGGAFSFMERDLPVSNHRPQPHMHKGPEGFYVLEGFIEFIVGGEGEEEGRDFGRWHRAGCRIHSATQVTLPRDC